MLCQSTPGESADALHGRYALHALPITELREQVILRINAVDSNFQKSASLSANHRISRADKTFMERSATIWTLLNQVTATD
jgi:hypothetical protein